ncbi:polysaccharide lyase family protein [Streptomyces sp. L7]
MNNGVLIYFKLTAAQAAAAHTLRVGVTTAYINARPQVTVNDWVSAVPTPPTQPLDARSHHGFLPWKQPHVRFQRPFQCMEFGRREVQRVEDQRRQWFDGLGVPQPGHVVRLTSTC